MKEFWERSVGETPGKSASKKRKVETLRPAKTKSKGKCVQAEEKFVEEIFSSMKRRITRTSTKKSIVSSRTSFAQLSSPILIDETPHASPGDHNLSIFVNATTHTVVNEENVEKEDDIPLLAFLHKLKKKRMESSASRDPTKGQVDDKA